MPFYYFFFCFQFLVFDLLLVLFSFITCYFENKVRFRHLYWISQQFRRYKSMKRTNEQIKQITLLCSSFFILNLFSSSILTRDSLHLFCPYMQTTDCMCSKRNERLVVYQYTWIHTTRATTLKCTMYIVRHSIFDFWIVNKNDSSPNKNQYLISMDMRWKNE